MCPTSPTGQIRREPPRFRLLEVRRVHDLSPRLRRLTLSGPELTDFPEPPAASSVRLLLPRSGESIIERPTWRGNEFLNADGSRPVIRTVTPRRYDGERSELAVEVVLHGATPLATWALDAAVGTPVALSGPGRGYDFDPHAESFVLAGDESALPAIAQLLEVLPSDSRITVLAEVAAPEARFELPEHPNATVDWLDLPVASEPGSALVDAVADMEIDSDTNFWAAGEAASIQRIRRYVFEDLGFSRSRAVVRGYWKHGRPG